MNVSYSAGGGRAIIRRLSVCHRRVGGCRHYHPKLFHRPNFSAVTALFLGASAKSGALLWVSIRIILTVLL